MTNEATRLAACPFCGSDKISEDFGDESGCVRCRNCGCQSGRVFFTEAEKESDDFSQSEADAREAWNRRAALAQPAVSEDALDAARYRWLRDEAVWRGEPDGTGNMLWCVIGHDAYNVTPVDGKDLDELVDLRVAAMSTPSQESPQ